MNWECYAPSGHVNYAAHRDHVHAFHGARFFQTGEQVAAVTHEPALSPLAQAWAELDEIDRLWGLDSALCAPESAAKPRRPLVPIPGAQGPAGDGVGFLLGILLAPWLAMAIVFAVGWVATYVLT